MSELSRLIRDARDALRPDIADEIESLDPGLHESHLVARYARAAAPTVHHGWQSYTNREVEIERWDLPRRPVWLITIGSGGMSGGEGWAEEDLVLTEYDVTDDRIGSAVREVLRWETGFTSEWVGTTSADRPDWVAQRREELAKRMHRWVDAVTALRAVDPRPVPPPKKGWREL